MTHSILLIDIGNSRIKWRMQELDAAFDGIDTPESISHHTENWQAQLKAAWSTLPAPRACCISNVASNDLLVTVKSILRELFTNLSDDHIHVIRPEQQRDRFKLAYAEPLQMGSDRFAQLLGAQALCAELNHLVISAGTATTIDGVLGNGQHAGGVIAPSLHLMRTSLHQYTARLPLDGGVFSTGTAPNNTVDALAAGAHLSRLGAVLAFVEYYMPPSTSHWLICGGDAATLSQDLQTAAIKHNATIRVVPSLCLLGLWQFYQPLLRA